MILIVKPHRVWQDTDLGSGAILIGSFKWWLASTIYGNHGDHATTPCIAHHPEATRMVQEPDQQVEIVVEKDQLLSPATMVCCD